MLNQRRVPDWKKHSNLIQFIEFILNDKLFIIIVQVHLKKEPKGNLKFSNMDPIQDK